MNPSRLKAKMPVTADFRLKPYLTPVEAAQYLGVCLDTVYNLIGSGRLRAKKFGRSYRIKLEWIDDGLLLDAAA